MHVFETVTFKNNINLIDSKPPGYHILRGYGRFDLIEQLSFEILYFSLML